MGPMQKLFAVSPLIRLKELNSCRGVRKPMKKSPNQFYPIVDPDGFLVPKISKVMNSIDDSPLMEAFSAFLSVLIATIQKVTKDGVINVDYGEKVEDSKHILDKGGFCDLMKENALNIKNSNGDSHLEDAGHQSSTTQGEQDPNEPNPANIPGTNGIGERGKKNKFWRNANVSLGLFAAATAVALCVSNVGKPDASSNDTTTVASHHNATAVVTALAVTDGVVILASVLAVAVYDKHPEFVKVLTIVSTTVGVTMVAIALAQFGGMKYPVLFGVIVSSSLIVLLVIIKGFDYFLPRINKVISIRVHHIKRTFAFNINIIKRAFGFNASLPSSVGSIDLESQ